MAETSTALSLPQKVEVPLSLKKARYLRALDLCRRGFTEEEITYILKKEGLFQDLVHCEDVGHLLRKTAQLLARLNKVKSKYVTPLSPEVDSSLRFELAGKLDLIYREAMDAGRHNIAISALMNKAKVMGLECVKKNSMKVTAQLNGGLRGEQKERIKMEFKGEMGTNSDFDIDQIGKEEVTDESRQLSCVR